MLKCKHCKGTEFGVTLTEVKTTPVKMKDGEAVGMLAEPVVEQSYEVNFCFTCNQNITEADLIENETCPVCGVEVPELVDGACPDCAAQKKKLLSMTKEELILMMMKQQMQSAHPAVSATSVEKEPKAKVEEEQKKNNVKQDEEDSSEKTPAKKKAPAKKKESEIKDVVEQEVVAATEEVTKSVEGADQPSSADNSKVADIAQVKVEDTSLDLPPVTEDDILDQLDSIDVDGLGLSDNDTDGLDLPF